MPGDSFITRTARAIYARRGYAWLIILYALLLHVARGFLVVMRPAVPWPGRLAAMIFLLGLAYLAWRTLRPQPGREPSAARVVPLALGLVAVGALARLTNSYVYIPLFLFACAYAFRFLPARWGLLIALTVMVATVGQQVASTLRAPSRDSFFAFAQSAWIFFPIVIVSWIAQLTRVSGERQRVIEELHATEGRLASAERQAGVLEERGRLAREIHDTLAQGLVSIVMHLEAAEQVLPPDAPAAAQHLDQARRAARDNLAEARRFVWALQPEALERDALPKAVTSLAERWRDEHHIAVTVSVTGDPCPLAPELEVTLLRAAQEALANVARHARAGQVTLTLSYMNDQVVMDVNDDGVGFDPARLDLEPTGDRYGLAGMRQRVERAGGRLTIESAPGEGTTVVVAIPILNPERP